MALSCKAIHGVGCNASAHRCGLPVLTRQTKVHRSPGTNCAAVAAAAAAPVASSIPPEYGYVIAAVGFGAATCQWMAIRVGSQRRKIGLKYPAQYSNGTSVEEVKFDCAQRAHMNTLENAPMFTVMAAVLGLLRPIPAASFIAVFFLARIAYFVGYASGDPGKRAPGLLLSFFAFLVTLGFASFVAGKTTGLL